MTQSLANSRPVNLGNIRKPRKKYRPGNSNSETVDAATLAASLQLKEQKRELIYSLIALSMKAGLLLLGLVSLLKLSFASYKRVDRHSEIASVLAVESARLRSVEKRFDELFTIGGDKRLIDEQDQWIAPNRVRVIWQ